MANAPVPSSTPAASNTPASAPAVADPKAPVAAPAVSAKPPVEEAYEVTIDGKSEKKTLKELREAYQLRQLSDKKRAEADKAIQEYNQMFGHLKQDPIKFFKAAGIDFDQLATGYLSKKAEEAMLDPKERELIEAKQKAAEYEKWVNEQKTLQQKQAAQAKIDTERKRIHEEIVQAVQENKELGLPVDEELIIAIAQKMILQDKKQKPLNAKEALPAAVESQKKFIQAVTSKMDGAALINWLGKDVAMKIRKYDLAELKKKRGANPAQPQAKVTPKVAEAPKKPYKTWSEFKAETLDNIK